MATGRPEAVLAAEESLGAAVRQLVAAAMSPDIDRSNLAAGLNAVRAALAKCQRLGRASAACLRAVTTADAAYRADGHMPPVLLRAVESRV